MTEYDYSPGAQQAHQAKLRQIAQWTANVPARPDQLANPFVPSTAGGDRRESDFYSSQSKGLRKQRRRRRSTRRMGGGWGYGSEGDDGSDSDSDGPDRPPTPPASAPATGAGFYSYGASPYYPQQPQQPFQQQAVLPNVLVPIWNGSTWVYQPVSSAGATAAYVTSPTGTAGQVDTYSIKTYDRDRGRERHKDSSRTEKRRGMSTRRNSHSVPAGGSYFFGGMNPQPGVSATGYLYPSISANTTPSPSSSAQWTTRSAPLPLPLSSGYQPTGGYFSPQPQVQPQPQQQQGSYFPQQPVYSPPGVMTSPGTYQVNVQSPAGSVHSGYLSPQPQPMAYGQGYGTAPAYGAYGFGGYGYGGAYGYAAGAYEKGQQSVVVMESAKKSKKGSSGRSLFGRLTGGM